MRKLFYKQGRSLKVIVAVLLLVAQAAALAHEHVHLGKSDAGMCRVCTLYSGMDTVSAAPVLAIYAPARLESLALPNLAGISSRYTTPAQPRAPPIQP